VKGCPVLKAKTVDMYLKQPGTVSRLFSHPCAENAVCPGQFKVMVTFQAGMVTAQIVAQVLC